MLIETSREISIDDVVRTAVQGENIEIAESTLANIEAANQRLNRIARSGKAVYGINTDLEFLPTRTSTVKKPCN